MSIINLDKIAAQKAQEIMKVKDESAGGKKIDIKKVEILATKALGVFQEQGIYAGTLFLLSRSGDKDISKLDAEKVIACYITKTLLNILESGPFKTWNYGLGKSLGWKEVNTNKTQILNKLTEANKLLDNLDHLFLVKNLYEQVLIYTRYAAKAEAVEKIETNSGGH
jgi:hypothetical protein